MEDRQAFESPLAHTDVSGALPSWDATDAHILDRAAELIIARGTAALTIAELARAAQVSRPTIYRRWSSAGDVVRAALVRRTVLLIDRFDTEITARADLVAEALRFADAFREDAVFGALLTREPAAFTQYSLERVGTSQRVLLRWLSNAIARAQAGGTVRTGDPGDLSVMLLLIVQSAVLSHNAVSALIGETEWRTELTHAIDGYLRP